MGAEIILTFIISLGAGMYLASNADEKQSDRTNKEMTDVDSKRMIQCRAMCGRDRVQSYDILTGECECIQFK